jgi:hypothetical protein
MLGNVRWLRVAGKGVEVGDEIEAIVLCLELEVLAHCAEKVTDVKSAARLYAR